MEKYIQTGLLLSVSGMIAYAILGYGRDLLDSGKVESKDYVYNRETEPTMFWLSTISVFLAGTIVPLLIFLMAMGIISA